MTIKYGLEPRHGIVQAVICDIGVRPEKRRDSHTSIQDGWSAIESWQPHPTGGRGILWTRQVYPDARGGPTANNGAGARLAVAEALNVRLDAALTKAKKAASDAFEARDSAISAVVAKSGVPGPATVLFSGSGAVTADAVTALEQGTTYLMLSGGKTYKSASKSALAAASAGEWVIIRWVGGL